jgi:hypothetical protein
MERALSTTNDSRYESPTLIELGTIAEQTLHG